MVRIFKVAGLVALVATVVYMGSVLKDRQTLNEAVLRLHVLANSDDSADQAVKQNVRDAVLRALEEPLSQVTSKTEALDQIQSHCAQLKEVADAVLEQAGVAHRATVRLVQEAFPTRMYDTFRLPAGVYDSLQITIGEGHGKNWWCVVFPGLCVPTAVEGVADTAVSAGFSRPLSAALTQQPGYQIRFFLLECLGRLQSYFRRCRVVRNDTFFDTRTDACVDCKKQLQDWHSHGIVERSFRE